MKYQITHTTDYRYSDNVTLCYNIAHLLPRNTPNQQCHLSQLEISPIPKKVDHWTDLFGNQQLSFSLQKPHKQLTVTAISEIEIEPAAPQVRQTISGTWEQAVTLLQESKDETLLETRVYVLESDFIEFSDEVATYMRLSFPPGRLLIDAVEDLMNRIYQDFQYDPGFSTIATPLQEVLKHKKGVCQDFAHLAIACLRMNGLAARYVSGYLETLPPEGEEKLTGADASHAWFSAYIPNYGWMDFDPTNAQIPVDQHITVAWGRDYSDVAPLKGVIFGGGKENKLNVSVDVNRL